MEVAVVKTSNFTTDHTHIIQSYLSSEFALSDYLTIIISNYIDYDQLSYS